MKKIFCVFEFTIGLVCLLVVSRSACADGFDFRKICWGMNRYEVMASENGAPKRMMPDEILYRISLFKRPTHLMYRFYEDRLVGARYVLPVKGADTLDKLEGLVSLRYGTARKETASVGALRVWDQPGQIVRLYFARKGQAVIDVVSPEVEAIPSKEEALLQRHTLETVVSSL